jgi:hypothetical protein
MTLQAPELLRYRGRTYSLQTEPLETCDDAALVERIKAQPLRSTALWRGYRCTWEIKRGRLWLVGLAGAASGYMSVTTHLHWDDGHPARPPLPIAADWFTGELVSGVGTAQRVYQYAQDWASYRVFHVERGVVVGTEMRDNRAELREGMARHAKLCRMLDEL